MTGVPPGRNPPTVGVAVPAAPAVVIPCVDAGSCEPVTAGPAVWIGRGVAGTIVETAVVAFGVLVSVGCAVVTSTRVGVGVVTICIVWLGAGVMVWMTGRAVAVQTSRATVTMVISNV
jgi:hypothetical protein